MEAQPIRMHRGGDVPHVRSCFEAVRGRFVTLIPPLAL
jgi:hypothetical protein